MIAVVESTSGTLAAAGAAPHPPWRWRARENVVQWSALDGLRGFSAIGVVITFAGLQDIYWRGRDASELPAFDRAAAGVIWFFRNVALRAIDVFFVLSSFLITGILLRTRGTAGYFR